MFPAATAAGRRFPTAFGRLAPTHNKKNTTMLLRRPCGLVNRVQHFSGGIIASRPIHKNFSMMPWNRLLSSFPIIHCRAAVVSFARRAFASQITTEEEYVKRMTEFQDLFIDARVATAELVESQGTELYEGMTEFAKSEVDLAVKTFEQLVMDIADPDDRNRVLYVNELRVEQLKRDVTLILRYKGWHDHSQKKTEDELRRRVLEFQGVFQGTRTAIADVVESRGTEYFDEDVVTAKTEVDRMVKAFEQLVMGTADPELRNQVKFGNELRVELLKRELAMALEHKGGDDH